MIYSYESVQCAGDMKLNRKDKKNILMGHSKKYTG